MHFSFYSRLGAYPWYVTEVFCCAASITNKFPMQKRCLKAAMWVLDSTNYLGKMLVSFQLRRRSLSTNTVERQL